MYKSLRGLSKLNMSKHLPGELTSGGLFDFIGERIKMQRMLYATWLCIALLTCMLIYMSPRVKIYLPLLDYVSRVHKFLFVRPSFMNRLWHGSPTDYRGILASYICLFHPIHTGVLFFLDC